MEIWKSPEPPGTSETPVNVAGLAVVGLPSVATCDLPLWEVIESVHAA